MTGWIRLCAAALALALSPLSAFSQTNDVTVFAAASMKDVLDAVVQDYTAQTGKRVAVSYAASSALAKQIEAGAPADLFISADTDWMDWLAQKNLIRAESRRNLLKNRIVLVAPKEKPQAVALTKGSLGAALGNERFAIANVESVPAGKYGKTALQNLGLWSEVSDHLAPAQDVRAALAFVARAEAPLGLVYSTDALAETRVAVVATFPETSHPAIIYPVALMASSQNGEGGRFLEFLGDAKSKAAFVKYGFAPFE